LNLIGIIMVAGGYLLGSVSAAIIVCRLFGLPDPRSSGSNNPGATNVLRMGGKFPALVTLAGDMLKGLIPVGIASWINLPPLYLTLVALAAVLGHLFPLFFQFRGGKGVATALGAVIGASPLTGALALATWLTVCLITRISSLSALITFVLVPVYFLIRGQSVVAIGFALVAVLLFYTHRTNLVRLRRGEEPRLGSQR